MVNSQLFANIEIHGTVTGRYSTNQPVFCDKPSCNKGIPLELEETGEQCIENAEYQRPRKLFKE